ncbi:MAG: hypothetical protein FWG79_04295 [Bacteroidales bacterium]|nr:hypothetical protein [Bacteroidales bacterium]
MKTLKNYAKMLAIVTILAMSPGVKGQEDEGRMAAYAESEIPKLDLKMGPEFKVSTKLGWFEMYGATGIDVMPLKKQLVYDPTKRGWEGEKEIQIRPKLASSLTAGIGIGNQNKLKIEARINNGWDETNPFIRSKLSVGYFREQQINEKEKINLYINLSGHDHTVLQSNFSSMNATAFETKVCYQRRISNRLNLYISANYLIPLVQEFHETPLPSELSANIGLHLDLSPKLPNIGFDKSKQKPRRKTHSQVHGQCYAYPQHRGKESTIFNRPNEMR